MPFVDVGKLRTHYELTSDKKPVVVLSNSLGTDFSMWDPQMVELQRHFRVLRYDTRGHGKSSVTLGDYSIEQLGRDVLGLLDSLSLERVNFCGLSMGGMIGMRGWEFTHLIDCNVLFYATRRLGSGQKRFGMRASPPCTKMG